MAENTPTQPTRRGQDLRAAELRVKITDLRKRGLSHRQIADQLGIAFQTSAKHVKRELGLLAKQAAENADEIRQLEVLRLDELLFALWPNRREPRYTDSILRVMSRRAELLGLDAPTKVDAKVESDVPMTPEERATALETILATAEKRRAERAAKIEEPAGKPESGGGAQG